MTVQEHFENVKEPSHGLTTQQPVYNHPLPSEKILRGRGGCTQASTENNNIFMK